MHKIVVYWTQWQDWQPECICGWKGRPHTNESDAKSDGDAHLANPDG